MQRENEEDFHVSFFCFSLVTSHFLLLYKMRVGILHNPLSGRNKRKPNLFQEVLSQHPEVAKVDIRTPTIYPRDHLLGDCAGVYCWENC